MKTILFYGDSNTWGYNPMPTRKYQENERFIGVLRGLVPQYRIVDEGLNGRTVATDDGFQPMRNGLEVLPMVLETHDPIDILVIMLGTNDTKRRFCLSAEEIAKDMERMILMVQATKTWGGMKTPEILLISPPSVTKDVKESEMEDAFDESSIEKSIKLAPLYQKLAQKYGCKYLNSMEYIEQGKIDGVHLDIEGHKILAEVLCKKLSEM